MKARTPTPGKQRSERGKGRHRPRVGAEPARFYYKGNRLKQLRAFCNAVKFGTVARAAEALFLSPSSVSLHCRPWKELGTRLLSTHLPRLALTRKNAVRHCAAAD
jgi:hypothetical protein